MRTRLLFVLFFFVLCIAVAAPALAASPTLLGGVSSDCINNGNCVFCDLLSAASSIISYLLLYVAAPVIAGVFGWGGWLFLTSGGNPGQREKGKSLAFKAITGFIIMLLGWFLVNSVISTIAGGSGWQWNVVTCNRPAFVNSITQTALGGGTGSGLTVGNATAQPCSSANSACSPAALQAADPTLTASQANVLSCIANTESSGNPAAMGAANANAVGLFQIMLTVNQLQGPACGNNGNPINCPSLCKGNNGAAVTTASCQVCVQAAQNPQCNAQSAQALMNQNPSNPYAPWTSQSDNPNSNSCVGQFSSASVYDAAHGI